MWHNMSKSKCKKKLWTPRPHTWMLMVEIQKGLHCKTVKIVETSTSVNRLLKTIRKSYINSLKSITTRTAIRKGVFHSRKHCYIYSLKQNSGEKCNLLIKEQVFNSLDPKKKSL